MDPLIKSQLLYQLSYAPVASELEPAEEAGFIVRSGGVRKGKIRGKNRAAPKPCLAPGLGYTGSRTCPQGTARAMGGEE